MTTATINTFKFSELSERAKESARDWWKENGLDEFECESITEGFQHKLEELGLPSDDVRWRLSSCQGDGVAFYGCVDVEEYLTKNKLKTKFRKLFDSDKDLLIDNVEIDKNQSFHLYDHHNTMSVSYNEALYNGYENPSREQALEDFTDHLNDHIKELSHEFVKQGTEAIDHYNSDENVDESIICNDYSFTEDGSHFS